MHEQRHCSRRKTGTTRRERKREAQLEAEATIRSDVQKKARPREAGALRKKKQA
jgi:hypothetical protein